MSADSIFQVTQALRARLEAALVDVGGGTVFVGPLDDSDARDASLILFLYRIAPNPALRNHEHVVISANPPPDVISFANALPLVLHYLITVGTRAGSDDQLLRLLGHAMRELNDDPQMSGVKVGNETVQVSLEPLSAEDMSRVWSLFPTANYRTSVGYLATPVWIDPRDPPTIARRVTEQKLAAGSKAAEFADG